MRRLCWKREYAVCVGKGMESVLGKNSKHVGTSKRCGSAHLAKIVM